MIKMVARVMDKFSAPKIAYAHCDVPCGIYDPHQAQVATHTVIRMQQLIGEHKDDAHAIARYTAVKEAHAELAKHEVRVIWGDYFKPEMLERHKDLHDLVFKIMKAGSKAKQTTNVAAAEELLQLVQKFAEIFWETKGKKTKRVAAPYPTGQDFVVPEL